MTRRTRIVAGAALAVAAVFAVASLGGPEGSADGPVPNDSSVAVPYSEDGDVMWGEVGR